MGRFLSGLVWDRGWGAACEVLSGIYEDGAYVARFCLGFPEMGWVASCEVLSGIPGMVHIL